MSRPAASRSFDALELRLAALATRRPGAALASAGALGALRNRLSGRWPSPEQVRALFPTLGSRQAARVAWRIGGLEARNRVMAEVLRRAGLEPLRPLVRAPLADLASLWPPLILGTFHIGAVHALGPALERLPGPVLALRHGPLFTPRPPLALLTSEGDDQRRAAAFQRLLAHLTGGGFVAMALDVTAGATLPARCLGRSLPLARGPFALARLTGARVVPIVARWRRGGVEVALGGPLAADPALASTDREGALAAAAAGWLERYLTAFPAELGLGLLRILLSTEVSPASGWR